MKECYTQKLAPGRGASVDLVHVDNGLWMVTRVFVPKEFRGRGHGSTLFAQVCMDADNEGTTLELVINAYDNALTGKELAEWYTRLGFKYDPNDAVWLRQPQSHL